MLTKFAPHIKFEEINISIYDVHLTASSESITINSSHYGFPDERDVVPPVQEVLLVIALEVSVLHLLDISSSSERLETTVGCIASRFVKLRAVQF